MSEPVIEHQPTVQAKDDLNHEHGTSAAGVEELAKKLAKNAKEVQEWTVEQVVDNFLKPVHLGHLAPYFVDHKVSGSVLVALTKSDLQYLGFPADRKIKRGDHSDIAIGDRVYLDNLLQTVRKGVNNMDMDRVIWKVYFPTGGFQYYASCREFMCYKCCGGCMERNMAELTPRGLTHRKRPPRKLIGCCVEFHDDYMDMRFLKDVDHTVTYKCCCNGCPRNLMVLTFEVDSDDAGNKKTFAIAHPILDDWMADEVKSMWAELRLVATD